MRVVERARLLRLGIRGQSERTSIALPPLCTVGAAELVPQASGKIALFSTATRNRFAHQASRKRLRQIAEVASDVNHLRHLLEVVVGNLNANTADSDEVRFERAAAIAWTARDLVEKISKDLD